MKLQGGSPHPHRVQTCAQDVDARTVTLKAVTQTQRASAQETEQLTDGKRSDPNEVTSEASEKIDQFPEDCPTTNLVPTGAPSNPNT